MNPRPVDENTLGTTRLANRIGERMHWWESQRRLVLSSAIGGVLTGAVSAFFLPW